LAAGRVQPLDVRSRAEGAPDRPATACGPVVTASDADHDLEIIAWSMRLSTIRRYFHQRFWERETTEAEFAGKLEGMPRLETVAEHSWHVADTIMILAPRFPAIDMPRAVMLAILHDKMEISIGDISPVGRDGTGNRTHAFNPQARQRKSESEREAAELYLRRLNNHAQLIQRVLLEELLNESTDESKFVKAVDKLQALVYVVEKKAGGMSDSHLKFTMQYSSKVLRWPPLSMHLDRLRERLFVDTAKQRNVEVAKIRRIALGEQDALFNFSEVASLDY